jgi:hypothetical protein
MCKITQEVSSQYAKDRCKCGQSTNFGALRLKIRCKNDCRRNGYGNLFGRKDPNCGMTSGLCTMTVTLRMMR